MSSPGGRGVRGRGKILGPPRIMARHLAQPEHAADVERRLHERGLTHLRARTQSVAIIVESGPDDAPRPHFRLRRDTVHLWWLDIARGSGAGWERTPFREYRDTLVEMVVERFGWVLADARAQPEPSRRRRS